MTYLGIDYGAKRVGLAVSRHGIAFPHSTLENDESLFPTLVELLKKEKIERIVMGDTRSMGGGENPVTKEAERFAEKLEKETGIAVEWIFEAGSSVAVSASSPEKRDDAAAAFILQRFLDMHGDTVQ